MTMKISKKDDDIFGTHDGSESDGLVEATRMPLQVPGQLTLGMTALSHGCLTGKANAPWRMPTWKQTAPIALRMTSLR